MRSSPNSLKSLYCTLAAVIACSAVQPLNAATAPEPVTVVFQNGLNDYYGTFDRRIGYVHADGGASATIAIDGGDQATDDTHASNILMRFEDIENLIPAGAKILKATITVVQGTGGNDHSGDSFNIYRLTRPFDSDSRMAADGDFGANGIVGDVDWLIGSFSPPNISATASVVTADVTRAVQSWVDGDPNHGFGIRCDRGTNAWVFRSTGAAQNVRPKLEVTYLLGQDVQEHIFQQGYNGYEDSFDIFLNGQGATSLVPGNTIIGRNVSEAWLDGLNPPTTEPDIPAMIKFGGIETAMAGRKIETARFKLVTGYSSGSADSPGPFTVHRLLVPFDETKRYSDYAGDAGAMLTAGQITPAIATFTSMADTEVVEVDIAEAVRAWAAGEPNYGLYIGSGTPNGWQIFTTGANNVRVLDVFMDGLSFRPEVRIVTTPELPVKVTFPQVNSRHDQGTPITFQANATAVSPITVTKVEFLIDGEVVGADEAAPFTFDYPADKLGNFVLTARMTDSATNETTSEEVPFSVVPVAGLGGLYFDGQTDHIALGDPEELKLSTFTVETWFKRETKGITTTTGTGGVVAVPLVAKGRNQADNSTLDTNWFLGIRESDGVILGDFEGGPGTNVPITGVTKIPYGQWNHVAMTFDGLYFRIYLNGNLEQEVKSETITPRADSIQHASIATAMNSNGLGEGAFGGFMDEVRIWNVARTPEQIRAKINSEVTSETGLVARWGMTEGTGRTITSTTESALTGNFSGEPIWTSGMLFSDNGLPTVAFTAPAEGSTYSRGDLVNIEVSTLDPDGSVMKVEYYDNGVLVHTATSAPFAFPYTMLSGNRRLTAVITDNAGGSTFADVGLLISGDLPAPAVQGLSAGVIDGGDEDVSPGGSAVVPAPWSVVSTTDSPLAFTDPGTTSGEIDVRINGTNVPVNSGVLLTTNVVLDGNTSSLDNHAPPYSQGGNYRVNNWDNNGPGELQPITTKESSSFSMGFFPYDKGWVGTTINADGTVMEGAGALPEGVAVVRAATGAYRISGLPIDGNMIAVAAGANSDDVASVRRSGDDLWEVLIRDNNERAENASFTFLYVPVSTGSVLSGQILENGAVAGTNKEASMVGVHTRRTVQGYELTFGDGSLINPSNTALFISGDPSAGPGADNIYSYFANGNSFTVFSHDLPGLNGVFQAGGFRFLAVPLNPRVPGNDEVAISVTKAFGTEGVEGDDTLVFTVGRSGSTAADLNVNYTVSGTATAGNDFTAPSGVVTIPAGQTSATITINILNDVLLEAEETVQITLTAGGGYSLSPYITSAGTIRNAASNIESTTLTFQQGNNDYTGTFQRRIARSANNDSATNGSAVQNYSMDGGIPDINDTMRFDNIIGDGPGQIPVGARVLKAELSMFTVTQADAQTGGPYVVGRLTQAVDENLTYELVHGSDGDTVSGIRAIVDRNNLTAGFGQVAQGEWNTADVTDVLRKWVEEGVPNHGFGIFSGGTTDAWNYCTIGNNTVENRPKLVVTYTTEPTELYSLVAESSAIFNSRSGSNTTDGSTIANQGYIKTAPNDTQEAMIKFPVVFDNSISGAIPLDRDIVKAELMIRTGSNNDAWTSGSGAIHQVIVPWTTTSEFGINGAQIGVHVAASSTAARGMGNRSYSWVDVTHIVRNWRAGDTNEGFNLKLSNAQNWGFHFPGDTNPAFAPVLRITTTRGSNPPEETPFEEWARLSGAPGISFTDDGDGDGLHALVEYALGFNPRGHDVLPGLTRNGSEVSISFPKGTLASGDTKLTYQIVSSSDLVEWEEETAATQNASSISLTVTEGEEKKFYRLKVTRNP